MPALAVVLLMAAGCANGDPAAREACDEPELTWSQEAASPGEVVTLHGSSMTTGCAGPPSEPDEHEPMRITEAALIVDGDTVAAPAVAAGIAADEDGVLQLELTVPDGAPAGAALTVELTDSQGAVVRSDELAIADADG
ncbi:hypothetical protein [Cellulosimicrobium sp. CUA-896]|uniref:hypothetical protein n=1 Tax=Cellulosimicrobium sp. CUA-896 TaxID=1517881 RepID=UPI00095CF758|nr:hypothetical protein [Cellulosimicrobium sp. CUA-896]OLT51706.1 hypothetical protein BJF88_14810 [Cellulosimicrobium sp. CUA-896]